MCIVRWKNSSLQGNELCPLNGFLLQRIFYIEELLQLRINLSPVYEPEYQPIRLLNLGNMRRSYPPIIIKGKDTAFVLCILTNFPQEVIYHGKLVYF